MKPYKLILLFFTIIQYSHAQQFTENTEIELNGIVYGEAQWINIDNNSSEELIISGYDDYYNSTSAMYSYQPENIGLMSFDMEAFSNSNIEILDFNNNGFTDFIINGFNSSDLPETLLYVNDTSGSFTSQNLSIPGTSTGEMKVGDFNNDNLDDIIITGMNANYTYIAKLYLQNNDGSFTDTPTPFFGNSYGSILSFDANNDGNLDILLTGFSNNYIPETKLYLNDGYAVFTEKIDAGIAEVYFSALSAADYDNDGDEDILISGYDSTYKPFTALYNNDGNANFNINTEINLANLYWGATNFVDYDNDGDLDIFITGADENTLPHIKFYNNINNVFTEDTNANTGIYATYVSSAHWSDYDNDGDMDFVLSGLNSNNDAISKVYTNQNENLSIEDVTPNTQLLLHPNPSVNKTVNLVYDENNLNSSKNAVTIYSSLGQKVYETALINSFHEYKKSLDLTSLENGIYLMQFTFDNKRITKKLILK